MLAMKYLEKYNCKTIVHSSTLSMIKQVCDENNNYYIIKEIDKSKYLNKHKKPFSKDDIIIKLNTRNTIPIKEIKDTNEKFYIVMDQCLCNLSEYIKIRKEPFSYGEIQYMLNQLNDIFRITKEKQITFKDLKLTNIFVSIVKNNKIQYYIHDLGLENKLNDDNNQFDNFLTVAPEIFKEDISSKNDIWSLGIIIYYLLFKEFPYKGNNEISFLKEIDTKGTKYLKNINDNDLNDLINRMLVNDINQRISWEEYFNHPFFKKHYHDENSPNFDLLCKRHCEMKEYYCNNCSENYCEFCKRNHDKNHKLIPFYEIGLNTIEIKKIEESFKVFKDRINVFNENKIELEKLINQLKKIKTNSNIYERKSSINYKNYYIQYLDYLIDKIHKIENVKTINLCGPKNNFIICHYEIPKEKINYPIQILNCFEQVQKNHPENELIDGFNEKEIRDNCEIFIDNKKIKFDFIYKFPKEGHYTITIQCKNPLKNINYLFSYCIFLKSIDFSNFISGNLLNMNSLFANCTSLQTIFFGNFNSINVVDMNRLFYQCTNLKNLDLSSLKTDNVVNMNSMFYYCSDLLELNLSKLNVSKVKDISNMFCNCKSLTKLILTNFKTDNVIFMNELFKNCSSLEYINLSKFRTSKVTLMNEMFYNCELIKTLDLSSFNTENVTTMSKMFYKCNNLEEIKLSNFNTSNVRDMTEMFYECSSLKTLNLSHFDTKNVQNMKFMFYACAALQHLDVTNFNTPNLLNMNSMFSNCSSLTDLDLSNFQTHKVSDMNSLFSGCISLKDLNVSQFNFKNVKDKKFMFYKCNSLKIEDNNELKTEILNDKKNINTLSKDIKKTGIKKSLTLNK